jgi:hypothetical protein
MTVVELHPEPLIDKELSGTLTADERLRLESHVATCSVCRFERLARADFRQHFLAEAHRAKLAAMVSLAVGVAGKAAAQPSAAGGSVRGDRTAEVHGEGGTASATPRADGASAPDAPSDTVRTSPLKTRRLGAVAAVAAAFLLASMAAAAWPSARRLVPGWARAAHEEARTRVEAEPRPSLPASLGPLDAPSPVGQASDPKGSLPGDPGPSRSHLVPETADELTPNVQRLANLLPRHGVTLTERSAAAMFAEANNALNRRQYARAHALYAELQERHRASSEARTALAILGRLALDARQPAAALRYFDTYLAGDEGSLGEEASIGRALALERLGRTDDAAEAWSSLLAVYPATAHASYARERMMALGGH